MRGVAPINDTTNAVFYGVLQELIGSLENASPTGTYTWVGNAGGYNGFVAQQVPGHLRVSTPWVSQYKSLGVNSATPNTAASTPEQVIVIWVRTSEPNISVTATVFSQPGDACRVGVFSGIQRQEITAMNKTPTGVVNFFGNYFSGGTSSVKGSTSRKGGKV